VKTAGSRVQFVAAAKGVTDPRPAAWSTVTAVEFAPGALVANVAPPISTNTILSDAVGIAWSSENFSDNRSIAVASIRFDAEHRFGCVGSDGDFGVPDWQCKLLGCHSPLMERDPRLASADCLTT
jgi:hypothetical protein